MNNDATTLLGPEAKLLWEYSPLAPIPKGGDLFDSSRKGCTYAFGLDYAWGMSSIRLGFSNAVKMKMSVIFAILHMNLGILIKGTNAIFRSNWPILICEVVAGLVILNGLFGWMDLLIFVKWMKPLNISNW